MYCLSTYIPTSSLIHMVVGGHCSNGCDKFFFYGLSNNLAAKAISYNYFDKRLPLDTVFIVD